MITAVDTNVVLDIFLDDPAFEPASLAALGRCSNEGRLVACPVVWAETTGFFESPSEANDALDRLGVEFSAIEMPAASAAGVAWRSYRASGGRREGVVSDFLIGAHALRQAERLLSRDRGFYRTYFAELELLDPSAG